LAAWPRPATHASSFAGLAFAFALPWALPAMPRSTAHASSFAGLAFAFALPRALAALPWPATHASLTGLTLAFALTGALPRIPLPASRTARYASLIIAWAGPVLADDWILFHASWIVLAGLLLALPSLAACRSASHSSLSTPAAVPL
jgi:hypothetical protein